MRKLVTMPEKTFYFMEFGGVVGIGLMLRPPQTADFKGKVG